MLWKDINMIEMIFKDPWNIVIFALIVVAVIGLALISPKSGTGPG